jgi:Peptidase family C25/Propeptide_C25
MNTVFVVFQGWSSVLRVGLSAALVYCLTFTFISASHASGIDENPAVDTAINRYVQDVRSAAPDAISPPGYRIFLLTQAGLARSFVNEGRLCLAEGVLQRLRRGLGRSVTIDDGQVTPLLASDIASELSADILNIETLLFSSPGTNACGGATTPTSQTSSPLDIITSADNHQVTFHVAFPQARFVPQQGNGQQFLQLIMPGMGNGGAQAIGTPELPMTGEIVAVPQDASITVELLGTSSYQLPAVQLWPVQPEPPAGDTTDLGPLPPGPAPFTINETAYAQTTPMPAALTSGGGVESMRGLPLSSVSITGAQYLPSARLLTVLTGMDIKVTFGGSSTGLFGTTDLTSVWNLAFQTLYQRTVINWSTAKQYLAPVSISPRLFCGEEMMVITTALLEPAATQFADDRTAHGVRARVFVIGPGGGIGTTPAAIRDAIAQEYSSADCALHPSYVTIVGDTTQVPTFEIPFLFSEFYESPVATDMPYGFIHQASQVDNFNGQLVDLNPDLLVGRLPAADLATAQTEVVTITAYEDHPPLVSDAYDTVLANAFFQPCPDPGCVNEESVPEVPSNKTPYSSFRASELAGQAAAFVGKTLQRVYTDESDVDTGLTITPLYYDDGTPLPSDVKLALATLHGHTTAQIESAVAVAVNNGAFLIWHSDHGYVNGGGWYEPSFSTSSVVGAVQNGVLPPVVWSSDCDSGKFDDPIFPIFSDVKPGNAISFSEQWLEQGSAVATVGASRESPIEFDDIMLQSMGSTLFPEANNASGAVLYEYLKQLAVGSMPPFQPHQPVTQVGPLLLATKLALSKGFPPDHWKTGTLLEYNEFGDPSMAIRRDAPITFTHSSVSAALVGLHTVLVQTTQEGVDGAVVTLTRDGQYIGRGLFQGGTAMIDVPRGLETLDGVQAVLAGDGTIPITVELVGTPPSPT